MANTHGDIIRVSAVWQTEAPRLPKMANRCLRGLICIDGRRARCTGVACQHTPDY